MELLLTIGLAALIIPGLMSGLVASRDGKPQQEQRMQATALLKETEAAVKNVRDDDWTTFTNLNTGVSYHPTISSNRWTLASGTASNAAGLTQNVILSDVYRNSSGAIVASPTGNTLDPSTIKADITISWTSPNVSSISSSIYLTRTSNLSYNHSTQAQFNAGTSVNTQVTNDSGGEIKIANNNKAKWCDPGFSEDANGNAVTIDLPDGPPVAVAATASATTSIPNDVFVATAPYATSTAKLAYVTVTANTESPQTTFKGKFTLDSSQYSSGTFPAGLNLSTNSFKTNDVKLYKSSSGNLYALLATDMATHEVIAVQITSGGNESYQDPVNKIYKYWTFFNTKRYGSASGNDQSPYSYGGISLEVFENKGYIASGGYLYSFDLSNIDSKSPTSSTGLDQAGCRIELDGYDCNVSTSRKAKYTGTNTNTSWSDSSAGAACSDGGNTEIYANNDIYPIRTTTGSPTGAFMFVAVGNGTDPELNIVNISTPPTSNLSQSSCGRTTSGWSKSDTFDFNTTSNTQEAANSVFVNSSGSRAYMSSNGGIDGNGDGQADSKQFYILNTSNKTATSFLTGSSTPTSGFYAGASPAPASNAELYPRRSLTVLNGQRAVLVGKDGVSNGNNAEEYQVLNVDSESTPTYCSGLDFADGFNDLTSVSEADYENYVYMIANNNFNELKIIQGGPDNAIYLPSGTFESQPFDTASIEPSTILRTFNRLLANVIQPATTSIKLQVAVRGLSGASCPTSGSDYTYVGPDGSASSYFTPTGSVIDNAIPFGSYLSNAYNNPERCFRYKVTLESPTDQTQTPVLQDITWNYSQ